MNLKDLARVIAVLLISPALSVLGAVWLFFTAPLHDFIKWYGVDHVRRTSALSWIVASALMILIQYLFVRKGGEYAKGSGLFVLPIASIIAYSAAFVVACGWLSGIISIGD